MSSIRTSSQQSQIELIRAIESLGAYDLPDRLQALKQLVPPAGSELAEITVVFVEKKRQTIFSSAGRPADDPRRIPLAGDDGVRFKDLVLALDAAERDARFADFVALKAFRDRFLNARGLPWADALEERQRVLEDAIDQDVILVSKVPNLRSPEFPVTAIRLNRAHPRVQDCLGKADRSGFSPVPIRGQPLSTTVLSERR